MEDTLVCILLTPIHVALTKVQNPDHDISAYLWVSAKDDVLIPNSKAFRFQDLFLHFLLNYTVLDRIITPDLFHHKKIKYCTPQQIT